MMLEVGKQHLFCSLGLRRRSQFVGLSGSGRVAMLKQS